MIIEISLASGDERLILQNLMQLYLYEFSVMDDIDVDDETGMFVDPNLERYLTEEGRYPFIVRANGKLAGFALVRKGSYFSAQENQAGKSMTVAEFFVMNKYRRKGIGTKVAIYLFDRFPGPWEVAQVAENHSGQAFWRSVIGEYSKGNYEEFDLDNEVWDGPVQVFDSSITSWE